MQFSFSNELTKNILFWIQDKKWLLVITTLGFLMYNLPYPDSISPAGYRTFILAIIVILLIITAVSYTHLRAHET